MTNTTIQMTAMVDNFSSAEQVLARIHQIRKVSKRRPYYRSKLDPFRSELVALKRAGGSLGDLKVWLRVEKKMSVERSTLHRYLGQLPELQAHA